MGDNDIILTTICILLVLIVVGGNIGLNVSGTLEKPDLDDSPPGLLGVLDWCWSGAQFFFAMIAFTVPGLPGWLSALFLALTLGTLFVLLKFVRGSNT